MNQRQGFLKRFPTNISSILHHCIERLDRFFKFYYSQTKSVLQSKCTTIYPSLNKTEVFHKFTCPSPHLTSSRLDKPQACPSPLTSQSILQVKLDT